MSETETEKDSHRGVTSNTFFEYIKKSKPFISISTSPPLTLVPSSIHKKKLKKKNQLTSRQPPPPPHRRPHQIPPLQSTSPPPPSRPDDLRDPERSIERGEKDEAERGREEQTDDEGDEEEEEEPWGVFEDFEF